MKTTASDMHCYEYVPVLALNKCFNLENCITQGRFNPYIPYPHICILPIKAKASQMV